MGAGCSDLWVVGADFPRVYADGHAPSWPSYSAKRAKPTETLSPPTDVAEIREMEGEWVNLLELQSRRISQGNKSGVEPESTETIAN